MKLPSSFFPGPAVLLRQQRIARFAAVGEFWLSLALLLGFLLYWTGIGFRCLLACALCALIPMHDRPVCKRLGGPTSIASRITLAAASDPASETVEPHVLAASTVADSLLPHVPMRVFSPPPDPLDVDYFVDILPTTIQELLLSCSF